MYIIISKHFLSKLQINWKQGDKNPANIATLFFKHEWYELLYQNHSSRLKIIALSLSEKCGGFYCRAFFPKGKSHSFSWLTQSRRIVDRHSLYFHHKTSKLYAMLGRFDCVLSSLSLLRFEHSCVVLWSSIFLIEKRRTLLIRLKHDPSIFWLITESSISFILSCFCHHRRTFLAP